jgi:hypothetical protein
VRAHPWHARVYLQRIQVLTGCTERLRAWVSRGRGAPTKAPPGDGAKTAADASHREGGVAKAIESQTAKLPSDLFLWAAFGSMAGSLALQMMGKKEQINFVGQ